MKTIKKLLGISLMLFSMFAFCSCTEEEMPEPIDQTSMFDEEGYELATANLDQKSAGNYALWAK